MVIRLFRDRLAGEMPATSARLVRVSPSESELVRPVERRLRREIPKDPSTQARTANIEQQVLGEQRQGMGLVKDSQG